MSGNNHFHLGNNFNNHTTHIPNFSLAGQSHVSDFHLPTPQFNTQPLLFSTHTTGSNHGLPPALPTLDNALDLSGHAASTMGNHHLGHHLELASLGINALETGHKIEFGLSHDLHNGVPATQAIMCNTLGGLVGGATDLLLKGAVASTTITGIGAAATTTSFGIATGNLPLAAAGGVAALTFANLAPPALEGAGRVAELNGDAVKEQCNNAFAGARFLSGGR